MDLYKIIDQLIEERNRLSKIIQSLEAMTAAGKVAVNPSGGRRGRKSMDSSARKEVSERMKLYWESRRKGRKEEQDEEAVA